MSIIYLMIPLAILLALVALVAFYWALNSGQFDDVETPAQRMLFDEVGSSMKKGEGE
jgi:cbb3-type cytochrome oxidase maturation protein